MSVDNLKIFFTNHARAWMRERGISQKSVKEALKNPTHVVLSFGKTTKIQKKTKEGILEVICQKKNDYVTIITTYYL